MDKTELIKKLKSFPTGKKVLVWNGEMLCAIENVSEYVCEGDVDNGAIVLYLEE